MKRIPIGLMRMSLICVPFVLTQVSVGSDWIERSDTLREEIRTVLTLPTERVPLASEVHRTTDGDGYRVESITYASESGSRVSALLYLPEVTERPVPAILVACGHGGSKSGFYAQYAGQLYAKLGFVCLVPDTIGEEEREADGRMGARGHDLYPLGEKNPEIANTQLKRSVMGKIVWDSMCGIDYLQTRPEVDCGRIGVAGYSLGGATAGCLGILDERVRAMVLCGWAFRGRYAVASKYCTRLPYDAFERLMGFDEMTALLAPHTATLFMCGTRDAVIDSDEDGAATVRELNANIERAHQILKAAGITGRIEVNWTPGAGHRPFFLSHRAVRWLQEHLMEPSERRSVPQEKVKFGDWVDSQGREIERLYNTERNERGLEAVACGAVLYDPKDLACFPEREKPSAEYTMQGWVDSILETDPSSRVPEHLASWMGPQDWKRDSKEQAVGLGDPGAFDDTHIFAPAVMQENGLYSMLYCGSRGAVAERIFRLGLAESADGVRFQKSDDSPVYGSSEGPLSVLTPTFLRGDGGVVLRENGLLRLWFSAADLTAENPPHTLRDSSGKDLQSLSTPSKALLDNVYAPTVIRDGEGYRVWYADVSAEPWTIRHAHSRDGKEWNVTPGPVLVIDQAWEERRLFYPTVVKSGGVYLMWYGAYWSGHPQMTALGFAASEDGVIWHKHPGNPVFRPEPAHDWESHYTTSQSVMRLEDGTWRIWYATRKAPPHVNKYFAIGTAYWPGPADTRGNQR